MQFNNTKEIALKNPRALKRSIFLAILAYFAIAAAIPPVSRAAEFGRQYSVVVNDVELPMDEEPVIRDLVLFIPLDESVLSALDAALALTPCGANECITVSSMGIDMTFMIGAADVTTSEGARFAADAAPFRDRGLVYVPARALFDALNLETAWDETTGILTAAYNITTTSPADRMAGMFHLEGAEKKEEEPAKVETPTAPAAISAPAAFETLTPYMSYTYENQTKFMSVAIAGDKTQSRAQEKGDFYNNLNIRFVGLLKNGYDFLGVFRTAQTNDTANKLGEVKKLELSMTKNKIQLQGYDIQPKFSRFMFNNYLLQGVNYTRQGNDFTIKSTVGKSLKRLRTSKYARYVGGVRIEKTLDTVKPCVLGASVARVRDTGTLLDLKRQDNVTYEADIVAELKEPWKLKAEMAASYNKFFEVGSGNGTAREVILEYASKKVNWKNQYTRNSADFYSETAFFTRGKNEFSSLYNRKISRRSLGGLGVKVKRLGNTRSYIYPANYKVKPFKGRDQFTLTLTRNFEKTIRENTRVIDSRGVQITDKIGASRVDVSFERRKRKTLSEHAYRQLYTATVRKPISEKMNGEFKIKRERWYHDRQSVTRQYDVKFDYELAPWVEMIAGFGRYYNTPRSARYTAKLGFHKVNILDDWEVRCMYQFQNYREYNINSLEMSYSFFK